jgi:hypothetical protein
MRWWRAGNGHLHDEFTKEFRNIWTANIDRMRWRPHADLGRLTDLAASAVVATDMNHGQDFEGEGEECTKGSVVTRLGRVLPPTSILRIVGWISVAAIAILSLVPGTVRPHVFATGQVEHLVAYAGTAAFLSGGYSAKRQLAAIAILLPVYAACMEILQIFVPGRTAQSIDAFVGAIGSWSGVLVVLLLRWRMAAIRD